MIELIIYLIGCYMSLFKAYGGAHHDRITLEKKDILFCILSSWIVFIIYFIIYITEDEEYFFKLTNYKNEKINTNISNFAQHWTNFM
jgi:hypothetical protein